MLYKSLPYVSMEKGPGQSPGWDSCGAHGSVFRNCFVSEALVLSHMMDAQPMPPGRGCNWKFISSWFYLDSYKECSLNLEEIISKFWFLSCLFKKTFNGIYFIHHRDLSFKQKPFPSSLIYLHFETLALFFSLPIFYKAPSDNQVDLSQRLLWT